jgi:DNA polymerase/3'-5' exonuclease PolX
MVPKDELAAATLYFTGSGPFNIAFRKHCLTLGYTLNEHALTKTGSVPDAPEPPPFKSERDIFAFVGLVYKEPAERTGTAVEKV